MFCMDLKQWAKQCGIGDLKSHVPLPPNAHNAIADAMWMRAAHGYLKERGE
jgi:hypothetical protein